MNGMEIALVVLVIDLRWQLDHGGPAQMISLDLSASFEMVDYQILIDCLSFLGIQGVFFFSIPICTSTEGCCQQQENT